MIQITPLQPFGCSITSVDLRSASDQEALTIRNATATHGFAVIRDQHDLGDTSFASFLQQLGPSMFTKGETAVAGHPSLNLVTNVGRDRPPRSVWHTDTSYVPQPPAFTALRVIHAPESGGETLIADQLAAYDELSEDLKARFKESTVLHGATGVDDDASCHHPLFRRHSETDRTAIFLSTPQRCTAISGVPAQEAEQIIKDLYAFGTQDQFVHRHAWKAGDVLIWDNRRTLHRGDHSAVIGDRVLHRGMVRGEAPLPV
ncbi:TauD/TfdA family dioxygenase [Lewinella sp. 4G2]|uniref:TauD/TfdA dioxygenase family protein n=1 Tax=Lewinella sp. 4G2 TaxID=1803372 RepID=UPI0007B4B6B6|nr:TauD/TfdA family dioxygenase [Lewinella sp. 4G2]OAV43353.1 hypothetical protein A3850_002065 [Lewinella sp. 4G2]